MDPVTSQNTFYIVAYTLGAVQGLFLAAILISRDRYDVPARILAFMMMAFSLDLAVAVYHASGLDEKFPALIGIDYPVAFLYGPLIFLYAYSLTRQPSGDPGRYWYLHFVPFVIATIIVMPFLLQSGVVKLGYINGSDTTALHAETWDWIFRTGNHIKLTMAVIYVGLTLVVISRHRKRVRENYSYVEWVNLTWLRNLLMGIIILAVLTIVLYGFSLAGNSPALGPDRTSHLDEYTLLGVSIFIYAIGFMGLRLPNVLGGSIDARLQQSMPEADPGALRESRKKIELTEEKARYSKSGMSDHAAQQHYARLLRIMSEEHPYRQSNLTLTDLSAMMDLSPHNLTEVINTRAGKNFYDFVNEYRVEEVKSRLVNPAYGHLTILAIGLESGFNSKSSFNSVFKKYTGMTPSQYKEKHA